MALTVSAATDQETYTPGEPVKLTASFSDPETSFQVNITVAGTASDGSTATAKTSYTVQPAAGASGPVEFTVGDDQGGTYSVQSNASGQAVWTSVAPEAPLAIVSGYGGTEPALASAGGGVSWQNYGWEVETWGTGPGQPKAGNAAVNSSGALVLTAQEVSGEYGGAEVDSVRGDQGVTGNPSTWGYGTYTWVIGADLSTLPQDMCFGLFTYWSSNKGGPAGQKEIDFEFYSAGTLPNAPAFLQMGFYQDTTAGVTQGTPPGHTLVPGSQFALPPGNTAYTCVLTWLPSSITWTLYAGSSASGTPLTTLTVNQGETYNYLQPYGGNQFSGTVNIPASGKQQVIMNLWCPNGTAPPNNPTVAVPINSFTYVQA